MNLDEGLKFQAEILKIKKIISKIKELGIDTTKIELIIKKIEEEIKEPISTICDNYNARETIDYVFKSDYIASHYREALKNILILEQKIIEEYNTYFEINGNLFLIENKLENITKTELLDLILLMKKTLKKLKESSTINFDDEKTLVEKTYQLTYQLIKLELINLGSNTLLDTVLKDEIDTNYTEKYLLEEIASLDSTNDITKLVLNRVNQLKANGLQGNYLDLELINLLTYISNPELINNKKEIIITTHNTLKKIETRISKINYEKQVQTKELEERKTIKNFVTKKLITYAGVTLGYVSLMIGSVVAINKAVKKNSYETEYYVTEQYYDASKDELTVEEGFKINKSGDFTKLDLYFPYQENTDQLNGNYEKFYREVYTYDISDISYDNIKDYTKLDLDNIGFDPKITYEFSSYLSEEDLYKIPRMYINKLIVDKNNTNERLDKFDWIINTTACSLVALIVEFAIFAAIFFRTETGYIEKLEEYIEEFETQEWNIQNQLEILAKLDLELNNLLLKHQELFDKLNQEYDMLPITLKQNSRLSKIKQKVKRLPQNKISN